MNLSFLSVIILIYISDFTVFSLDAAEAWGMNFQDPATPIMEGIIEFHNYFIFFITLKKFFFFKILNKPIKK